MVYCLAGRLKMQHNKGQIIGYARVSSSGQSLDIQIDKLKEYGCDKIYQEKISGQEQNRPELLACLDYLREGDVLVVTRLDRMARSSLHLGQLAENLKNKKVDLKVIDQQVDTSSIEGKLMFNMLSIIAEFENDIRKERQLEGIKKAKEKGIKFGRKFKLTRENVSHIKLDIEKDLSVNAILQKHDISRRTFYNIKNNEHPFCAELKNAS